MARTTKKMIYAKYGIEYNSKTQKVYNEFFGQWINKPLVKGNKKIGEKCHHFSTLPTNQNFTINVFDAVLIVKGTCKCTCKDKDGNPTCYATKGNYNFPSVQKALAIRTLLTRKCLSWLKRCIMAQIEADKIDMCRIHASGDFDSMEYLQMWVSIVRAFPNVKFWTYTKIREFETAFDSFPNANIVKSVIDGYGYNYGHCDYIMDVYNDLTAKGETVHICRCGVDSEQHCSNCTGCSVNRYVLFIEHSTDYVAQADPNFPKLAEIIENQSSMIC